MKRFFIGICLCAAAALAAIGAAMYADAPASGSRSIESSAPQMLSPGDLTALLDRFEKALLDMRTLQAHFVQEKHLSIFSDVVKSQGMLFFQRPDKVRFEITEPFQSAIISDGKSAARYEHDDKGWRKLNAGDAGVMLIVTKEIGMWIEGRLRARSEVYDISAQAGSPPVVVLTPKDASFLKYISSIRLYLDEAVTRVTEVRICEPGGDYTVMRYLGEVRNAELPAATFSTAGKAPGDIGRDGKADARTR